MRSVTEHTVSTAQTAALLFQDPDDSANRRGRRSPEPGLAVGFQFERVYDVVGAEAIVLCDDKGHKLKSVGDPQLCRMLARSTPTIWAGAATREVTLKGMELIRPYLDWTDIAIQPIQVPQRQSKLYVASVSESTFNEAGAHHARQGVRRILGIPESPSGPLHRVVSSRDRLAWDVSKALTAGYYDFNGSALAIELRVPKRFGPRKGDYTKALDLMLWRVDQRLEREGLYVERPTFFERLFARGEVAMEGYRSYRFHLAVRRGSTGRRLGTLNLEMNVYDRAFCLPQPPTAVLVLDRE
jgi:hypothetical protein